MSGVTSNTARRVRKGATLPATCVLGEVFMKTSGGNEGLYVCSVSVNTWSGPLDSTSDTGDFVGPASSTDNALVRFDGAGGKTGQNSLVTVDDNGSVNIPAGETYKINNANAIPVKASGAEVTTGTDDAKFVTAKALADAGIAAGGGGGASYLKYVALLTQSGTDAPVATVLENTLGGTVVWTRTDIGIYVGTLSGAFTTNKTVLNWSMSSIDPSGGNSGWFQATRTSANAVTLEYARNGEYLDWSDPGISASVTISVYP